MHEPPSDPSASGRSPRMERRRARTREALLSAAHSLLATRPAEAVNVDEIVELADLAKGTFYNYFADKDALVRELEQSARKDLENLIARTNAGQSDAAARVSQAFASALIWALADPMRARTLMRMTPHFADPEAPINAGVRRDIRDGTAAGRFQGTTNEAGVVLVLSVISGGVNRALDLEQPKKVRALGESLSTALLVALGLEREEAAALSQRAMIALGKS